MIEMVKPNVFLGKGDCIELMAEIPDKSIDLILCDLPYGTTNNKWDSVISLEDMWSAYKRILSQNGTIVLTSQGIFTARLILSNENWFKYKWVWEKSKATNFLNAKKQPLRKHEDICVFYLNQTIYNPQMNKGAPYDKGVRKAQQTGSYGEFEPVKIASEGPRYPTDVLYFKTAESEPEHTVWHPTQKPVELMRYFVRTYTNENQIVLDNCMGSGTTGIACLLEKRKFIGVENDDKYFSIAKKRLLEHD